MKKFVLITVVLCMAAVAQAALSTKSSFNFSHRNWEGGTVPSAINGTTSDGSWTSDGGILTIAQNGVKGDAGMNNYNSGTTIADIGYTMEMRFQITADAPGTALEVIFAGNDTNGVHHNYYSIFIDATTIANYNASPFITGLDFTDDFHTLRLAYSGDIAGTEDDYEIHMWIDDVEVAAPATQTAAMHYDRQWFGGNGWVGSTAVGAGNTVDIDYYRIDTTGGYAPELPAALPLKNSIHFSHKNWEGDAVPSAVSGTTSDGSWTSDGNILTIAQNGATGDAGMNNYNSGTTIADIGYTMEMRFQITADAPGTALEVIFAGNDTNSVHHNYYSIFIDATTIANYNVSPFITGFDFTNGFHTLRLAYSGDIAGTEDDYEIHMWIDRVEVAAPTTQTTAMHYDRQWFGGNGWVGSTAVGAGNTVDIDYYRIDTTGGYAHAPIPVPSSLVLLVLGALSGLCRRRLR